ncbi:MAG: hypothetical protein GX958_02025, partial [Desulfitobacterium sp.]|nr:hypothetical protein [Desulfitobacterium sp.]
MLKKLSIIFSVLLIAVVLGGCGNDTDANGEPQQNSTIEQENKDETAEAPKLEYLEPVPEGTPIGEANMNISEQLMAQKDILGVNIYEQMET